jgi:hypothetical protein
MLLTRRFVCFIRAHKHIHKGTAHTSAWSANRWKKYRNNSHSFSLSLPLFCSIVCLASHIHPSFFLLLRLEATTSITTTTTITHTHKPLSVIIIINNNTSSERDERASEFLFRSQGKRGGNRLSWRCRRLFYYWAFYLFLSLLCVCVCMAGRYCFRLIAAVVVDFSPLLFTHTHTCRSFSSFILLPKKNEKHFHSSYIHTYLF